MPKEISRWHRAEMPIPAGMQIYESELYVAGIHHRRSDAQQFIAGQQQRLEIEPEPGNPYDPNALRVMGCWRQSGRDERRQIGYVPSEVSAKIVERGFSARVAPRLWHTYCGDTGYVDVVFQLLGPKKEKARYGEESHGAGQAVTREAPTKPVVTYAVAPQPRTGRSGRPARRGGCLALPTWLWILLAIGAAFACVLANGAR